MSICIKDQIQNMNLVIGCTVGCAYCYARNNVKRWHMIDDFAAPEFFPGKLKMMEKKSPKNFLQCQNLNQQMVQILLQCGIYC